MVQIFQLAPAGMAERRVVFHPFGVAALVRIRRLACVGGPGVADHRQSRAVLVLAILFLVCSLVITLSWEFKALEGFDTAKR